jgi:hypothetical protein
MIPQLMDVARRTAKALLEPLSRPVHQLRDLATVAPGLALLVLAVLLVTAVMAIRGSRLAALALIPLALVWLVVNNPFEGPTLMVLSWSHGVTASDLISVVALGISGWRLTQAVVAPLR